MNLELNSNLLYVNKELITSMKAMQESMETIMHYHRTLHLVLAARQAKEGVLEFPSIDNYDELVGLYNEGKLRSALGGKKLEILDQDFKLFNKVKLNEPTTTN